MRDIFKAFFGGFKIGWRSPMPLEIFALIIIFGFIEIYLDTNVSRLDGRVLAIEHFIEFTKTEEKTYENR